MSALFLELARTVRFLSSSPLTFRLKMISSVVVLGPHSEVEKALPVVRLATHKHLLSVDAVVELLATTLADKHMATVLPKGEARNGKKNTQHQYLPCCYQKSSSM